MTNEERVKKFKNHETVINCQTFEEAKAFIKWCYENNIKWGDDKLNKNIISWTNEDTCYRYDYDNTLVYARADFYRTNYKIIKYKDFFEEQEETNLDVLLKTVTSEREDGIPCTLLYELKYNKTCDIIKCDNCEFNKTLDCLKYLKERYNKSIKLTKFEYDILNIREEFDKSHFEVPLENNIYFVGLKKMGYFKNIDLKMTAKEILDDCEIIEE